MLIRGRRQDVPTHLRHLVRDLDSVGDGSGRSLVRWLAGAQVWEPYFQIVRWRERRGRYRLEHDELYVLAMVNALGGGMDADVLSRALVEDDDLRESTFWRIFEVPGTAQVNLAYLDRYRGEPGQGWEASIRALVADGTLQRDRVAEACLSTSQWEFSEAERAWFARLHVRLVSTSATSDRSIFRPLPR